MLKIKFSDANKTEYAYLEAKSTEEYYNGSNRRILTVAAADDAISVDALNTLANTESNLASITLRNTDTGTVSVNDGYVLKLGVGIEPMLITPETPEAAAIYEDRLVLKLGKRTYIEQQLHDLGL